MPQAAKYNYQQASICKPYWKQPIQDSWLLLSRLNNKTAHSLADKKIWQKADRLSNRIRQRLRFHLLFEMFLGVWLLRLPLLSMTKLYSYNLCKELVTILFYFLSIFLLSLVIHYCSVLVWSVMHCPVWNFIFKRIIRIAIRHWLAHIMAHGLSLLGLQLMPSKLCCMLLTGHRQLWHGFRHNLHINCGRQRKTFWRYVLVLFSDV